MTGNQTPYRQTWTEQQQMDRAIGKIIERQLARERTKMRLRHLLEDLIGVAALMTLVVCFLVFTI